MILRRLSCSRADWVELQEERIEVLGGIQATQDADEMKRSLMEWRGCVHSGGIEDANRGDMGCPGCSGKTEIGLRSWL